MAFFAPHLALLVTVVLAERCDWAGWWWIPTLLGVLLVMPHWCRWQGERWPRSLALMLGPGAPAGAAALLILRGGLGDDLMGWMWTLALLFIVLCYVVYAALVFDNRRPLRP